MSDHPPPPALQSHWIHLSIQGSALIAALGATWIYQWIFVTPPPPWFTISLITGAIALTLSLFLRCPWWWITIHACFFPAVVVALNTHIAPEWYFVSFLALFLAFRSATVARIPLYFSGTRTLCALTAILRTRKDLKFADLGAGIGSAVVHLARIFPDSRITGVENSPAPWLIGRLRTLRSANCRWIYGNFWRIWLGDYNAVYVFLSPAPMADIWQKARHEMPPGSLLISNSFSCPGVEPTFVVEVGDWRDTKLYCYTIGETSAQTNTSPCDHHHGLRATRNTEHLENGSQMNFDRPLR